MPFVTADLPGSGGHVKASPEDFRVDELPSYAPAGAGAHLYLHVEKRGLTTRDVVRSLARALGVQDRDVGAAGLKDKAAVTTQWLSFPVARDPDPALLAGDGFRVLTASRHGNKLRAGHLRGNRFTIAVREGDVERARGCAAALAARGLANFYGAQRFGAAGRNADVGRALLLGRLDDPEARRASRDRFLR
ncbi:MAG: tRNA pseudouridine(13) synthase TruD, partial [Anaeromyxobacteraceae bacterium]